MLASSNVLTSFLNIGVGIALSTCNFIITGCILEFQMDEINPGFMRAGKRLVLSQIIKTFKEHFASWLHRILKQENGCESVLNQTCARDEFRSNYTF